MLISYGKIFPIEIENYLYLILILKNNETKL
jgi:hypothetical protein